MGYDSVSITGMFTELKIIFREQLKIKELSLNVEINDIFPETLLLDETRVRQILLDIKRPEMDGSEVIQRVAANSELNKIR